MGLLYRDNIRQVPDLWRLDQADTSPRFMQYMGIEEFEAVQIELNGTPGVRLQQFREVIGQLLFGQIVDLVVEIRTDASYRAGLSFNRLWLQPFQLQVLQMRLIIFLEI